MKTCQISGDGVVVIGVTHSRSLEEIRRGVEECVGVRQLELPGICPTYFESVCVG